MTTSAQILAAWKAAVFDHADLQAETRRCFDYDAIADIGSLGEDSALRFNQRINFITYLTARRTETGSIRGTNTVVDRYTHQLDVDYYLEKNLSNASQNYNEAIRVIELVDDLVRSELGKTWGDTVDFYQFTDLRRPQLIDLDGKKVWRVGHSYIGTKTV